MRFVRARGASRVVVMGSSLGAQATLTVAGRNDVAAVVGVSPATVPDGLDAITAPAFFVASAGTGVRRRTPARSGATSTGRLGSFAGSEHGADLFTDHPEATRSVVAFLRRSSRRPRDPGTLTPRRGSASLR